MAGAEVANSIYEILRSAILSGELPPGASVAENVLAKQYGVSRTPIREAVLKLRHDGFVEANGRRLEVRRQSPEEILEIYAMRVLLEEFATRAAALNRSDLDLDRLSRLHEGMAALPAEDIDGFIRGDHAFHRQIWSAARNRTLADVLDRIGMQLRRYPQSTITYPGRREAVLEHHAVIVDAVRDRDADAAGAAARLHMETAQEIRLKMLAQAPDLGGAHP